MTRRALGTLLVLFLVATAAIWVRTRPNTPEVDVKPVSVAMATTTTEAPTTTTAPPAPARASRAVVRAPATPLPPAEPALRGPFWVAAATGDAINVYRAPRGELQERLPGTTEALTTTILLVKHRVDEEWLEAYMPTRPNQHTGFVRTAEVSLSTVDTQIKVELGFRRLTAWAGDQMISQQRIVVGKPSTPTPTGIYYLAMLFRSPNPRGAYGPYVYGLSAHSNVYERFGGGDGMVGVHGTNQPGLMGSAASNGCIRMTNDAITALINAVPVGSPIVITG